MRKLALFASVLATACGGGGGGGTGSPAAPTGPSRSLIAQGSVQLAAPVTAISQGRFCDIFGFFGFTTSAPGTLDVTVDWTFASNDVDVHLERGECNCSQAQAGACQDVAGSESTTAKPERLSVPNLAAGAYTLVVVNTGPGSESASYQVGLTR